MCGEICRAAGLDIKAADKLRACLPTCRSYPDITTKAKFTGKSVVREPGGSHDPQADSALAQGSRPIVHLVTVPDYIQSLEQRDPRQLDAHYKPM